MDENVVVKKTMLDKIFSFVSSLSKENKKTKEEKSRFNFYLEGIDKSSEVYSYVNTAAELCDDAAKVSKRRNILCDKIKSIDSRMEEIECFHKLSNEETEQLKSLLDRFVSVSKEKTTLHYQLSGFEQGLGYLEDIEEDANFALEQIQESEKKQRILRHDIGYIEGEKADLEYEKEQMEKGLMLTRKFTLFLLAILIVCASLFAYSYIYAGIDIFKPSAILSLSIVILMSVLFVFRRRTKFEIQLNIKKQNRAVSLLNKKNTVLAYYTNFLRYEYKKYRVNNSQSLKNNLNELNHYRYLSKRYDVLRKIMYKAEEEIETFFKHKNIKTINASVEKFSQSISLDDKRKYYNELEKEKAVLEEDLEVLDKKYEEIWDLLIILNENDKSEEGFVEQLIQQYFEEVAIDKNPIDKNAVIV